MSSMSKARLWLCMAAAAASLWVTFRVLEAQANPWPAGAGQGSASSSEIPDPALDAMIHRFATRVN